MDTSHARPQQELQRRSQDVSLVGYQGTALLPRLGLLVALALLVWVGALQLVPPAVVPASAPATSFSAERAMADLRVIAAAPRSPGEPGLAASRQYLVDQLTALGLTPEIQTVPSHNRFPGETRFTAGIVQNVIARIPGSAGSDAIVLNAHYDSGHTGAGASDCGACVVAVLETVRAIRAGPPLKHDLIVVFDDGEELHDIGARAFTRQHPWAQDTRLTINFESQGSRGPALLYATSPENGWLVSEYLAAAPHPRGSSYFVGLIQLFASQRLACDLAEYLDIGSAGLGFVYTGDTPAYHTARDSMEEIDPRSLQHFGANTLALVRHFDTQDLSALPRAPEAVFFNLLPDLVVYYPATWVLPLNLLITLGALLLIGYGLWRRRLGLGGTLGGGLALLLGIPLSVALVLGLWWAVRALTPNYQVLMIGTYQTPLNVAGLALVTTGLMAGFVALLRLRAAPLSLAAGGVLAGLLLLWPLSLALPGASYLLTWPLLFSLLPLAVALVAPAWAERAWAQAALLALAALPGLLMLPLNLHINTALLDRFEGELGQPYLAMVALFVAPLGLVLVAQILFLGGQNDHPHGRWLVSGGALLVGLAILVGASLSSGYSPAHPRTDKIGYVLNADTGTAQWVSPDPHLDHYTSQFIPAGTAPVALPAARYVGKGPGPAYTAGAPLVPLEAPEVTLRDDQTVDGVRTIQLHIASPRDAAQIELRAEAPGPILAATLDGLPIDLHDYVPAQAGTFNLTYGGGQRQGFDLTLAVRGSGELTLAVADLSNGLPTIPGFTTPPRPADTMPSPGMLWDPTVVLRSYRF